MTSQRDIILKAELILVFLIMAAGALLKVWPVQLLGVSLFCFFIICANIKNGMAQIMAMVPNIAVMSIASGPGLLVLAFIILLIKISANKQYGIKIWPICILIFFYLFCLSFTRLFNGNLYDFALICQVAIIVITWTSLLGKSTTEESLLFIDYFRFGCLLMSLGMLISYPFQVDAIDRFKAILGDCNYTEAVMCVLFGISLLTYCYKLPLKQNAFYMTLALIMGLATGSRGFMLSTAIILFLLLLTKSFGKKSAKIVLIALLLMAFVYVLYLANFSPVMTIYDNTFGRTMELEESHIEGNFMDATSGRSILWAYYMLEAMKDPSIFIFGRGFFNYHLEENGGFGLAAHNMYISSIIGIGIVGTFLVLIMYFNILKSGYIKKHNKINIAFSSIIIALFINYFFLDGMLELRLITYHAMVVLLMLIYKSSCLKIKEFEKL